jgi:hypothetical protein
MPYLLIEKSGVDVVSSFVFRGGSTTDYVNSKQIVAARAAWRINLRRL